MTRRPGPDSEFGFTPLTDDERRARIIEREENIVMQLFGIVLVVGEHPLNPGQVNIACLTLQNAREKGVDAEFIETAWLGIRMSSPLDGLTHEQAIARLLRPQ